MKLIKKVLEKVSNYKDSQVSTLHKQICIVIATLVVVAGTSATFASQQSSITAIAETVDVLPEESTTLVAEETTVPTSTTESTCDITIKRYGKSNSYEVKPVTVKTVLKAAKVTLAKKDVLNCKLSQTVSDGMKIVINKVAYKTKTTKKTISYKKCLEKYKQAKKKNLTKNANVIVTKTYNIKYVNDKKAKVTLKKTKFKSVSTISYSSLNAVSTLTPTTDFKLSKSGVPLNYSKKITGNASAYSCGTHTATGKSVRPGYIAVNPNIIPYGTKLYIRSTDGSYIYGYASAEDTGGFIYWNSAPIADLYFSSNSDCIAFGRRNIEIYVLN